MAIFDFSYRTDSFGSFGYLISNSDIGFRVAGGELPVKVETSETPAVWPAIFHWANKTRFVLRLPGADVPNRRVEMDISGFPSRIYSFTAAS